MAKLSSSEKNLKKTPKSKWRATMEITRFNKPIGNFLLLAPTLWGVMLANRGFPDLTTLLIFTSGAFIMRSAGCVANDLADRNLDGYVERTRNRPLVIGTLKVGEAIIILSTLLAIALSLVIMTNSLTIKLSLVGVFLALVYPLTKRVTYFPQIILGLAFSWSIPMAYTASLNALPPSLWWLFVANVLWTVIYDTQYAMVDREDDLKVGIKSTAILFGEFDVRLVGLLQALCLMAFWQFGLVSKLGLAYFCSVTIVAGLFLWHLYLIKDRETKKCFTAFNQSKWIGLIILLGICTNFWIPLGSFS